MTPDDDYQSWLKHRRATSVSDDVTDRVMAAIREPTRRVRPAARIGLVLLWTAASLVFVTRIAALVGNVIFPTDSYPEFAVDQRIEEVPHDHRKPTRS
ncbi:MAG TPA: hypothetical protein VGM98_04390 [Schlesneria sp.]|jgi:hypothetical protein